MRLQSVCSGLSLPSLTCVPLKGGKTEAWGLASVPTLLVGMQQDHPCPALGSVQRTAGHNPPLKEPLSSCVLQQALRQPELPLLPPA